MVKLSTCFPPKLHPVSQTVRIREVSLREARQLLGGGFQSMVEREEEAAVLQHVLSLNIPTGVNQPVNPGETVVSIFPSGEGLKTLVIEVEGEEECLCLTCEYSDECDEYWTECFSTPCMECRAKKKTCAEWERRIDC